MRCRILLSESKLRVIDNITVIEKGIQPFLYISSSNFESFLKTGTTFAVLSTDGKTPFMKERLNKLPLASKFHFLERIIFFKVYYLGQVPY